MKSSAQSEGKRRGAHGESDETLSGLGDVLSAVNRTAAIAGRGDEDDDAPVDWGLLWSRASVCSSMGSGRSS